MYLIAVAGGLVGQHVPPDLQLGDHHEGRAEQEGQQQAGDGQPHRLHVIFYLTYFTSSFQNITNGRKTLNHFSISKSLKIRSCQPVTHRFYD